MNKKQKKELPEALRKALSEAGKKGWRARVENAKKVGKKEVK